MDTMPAGGRRVGFKRGNPAGIERVKGRKVRLRRSAPIERVAGLLPASLAIGTNHLRVLRVKTSKAFVVPHLPVSQQRVYAHRLLFAGDDDEVDLDGRPALQPGERVFGHDNRNAVDLLMAFES